MDNSLLNLTRDECAHRSKVIDLDTYRVELDLHAIDDPKTTTFASSSTVEFTPTEDKTWLDLVADSVTSVTVNGKEHLEDAKAYNGARVPITGLEVGKHNTVTVVAQCKYSRTGEGLHRFTDTADGKTYAYTHFEPTDARRMYACFEQPDLKACITFVITAPKTSGVFSNQDAASDKAGDNDSHTVTFNPTRPLSTYLTSIAVGPYYVVRDEYKEGDLEVPLAAICRESMKQYLDAKEVFRVTKAGLTFFNDAFGYTYPWGKYDTIFLPEYNIGAMEHPGLVTFSENAYIFRGTPTTMQRERLANTILHEMTHMWFGDLATPRWWNDTWLKESFADLMGYLVSTEQAGFNGSWISFALGRKQWAYVADTRPSTHPIAADVPDLETARQVFDGISYAKGASVLKQLMAYAGRDAFLDASKAYFNKHAFGSTTLDDFVSCLKDSSDADLSTWVPSWLETAGPSIITTERDGDKLFVTTESVDAMTGKPVQRNHRVTVSTFARGDQGVKRTASVSVLLDKPRVEVPLPEGAVVDLAIANDEDLTYALLRFDAKSVDILTENISSLEPTLTRAVAWSALWNMVRDAKLPAARFLEAVHNNLLSESDAGILGLVLGLTGSAIGNFLPPKARPDAAANLIKTLAKGLAAAEPGSDQQRQWANALVRDSSESPSGEAHLRDVLDGKVSGLEVTPTLRWRALASLAVLGKTDKSELEAEYKRDSTMTGATALARAEASFPGVEVKRRVWNELTTESLTNDRQGALIFGFDQGPSSDRKEFVAPYFENLTKWWKEMTMTMATRLARGLFPNSGIEDGKLGSNTVEKAAQDWLDQNEDAPKSLRRIVIEGLAGQRRKLTAQEL